MNPNHRPDIDGLRGLAVLLVLLYHAKLGVLPGGYVGVDVFLVISGFLITGLLLRQMDQSEFSYLAFVSRRMRRLMPAAVVVVAATLLVALLFMGPRDLRTLAGSCLAVFMLGANVYFWGRQGYFADQVPEQPLLHTWSLGLEEQFYLVYPAAMLLVARVQQGRMQFAAVVVACAALFAFSVWVTGKHPGAAFYLLPTRAWEFLIGAAAALAPPAVAGQRWAREFATGLGLVGIAAAAFGLTRTTPYPGVAALVPAGATALIMWANATGPTVAASLLRWRVLTAIGLVSYSLYLWHWPVFALARYYLATDLNSIEAASALVGVAVLAYLSWKFIEQPFRIRSGASGAARPLAPIQSLALGVAALALVTVLADGLPQRLPPQALALDSLKVNDAPGENGCHRGPPEVVGLNDFCVISGKVAPAGGILLWGDSHANAVSLAMAQLGTQRGVNVWQASYSSCPPLLGSRLARTAAPDLCVDFNQTVLRAVRELGIKRVVLAAYWSYYLPKKSEPAFARALDPYSRGDDLGGGDEQRNRDNFVRGLQRTVATLRELGADVWIVQQVPTQRQFVPMMLSRAASRGQDFSTLGISAEEYLQSQAEVNSAFAALGAPVKLIDIAAAYCSSGRCLASSAGRSLYLDSHHLSPFGAELAMSQLRAVFD